MDTDTHCKRLTADILIWEKIQNQNTNTAEHAQIELIVFCCKTKLLTPSSDKNKTS